jgi:uncharacterized protein YaaQ
MMQLLVAIVQDQDAGLLCDRLSARAFRVTRINTVGGFLRTGNVTILLGLEDSQIPEALAVIGKTCHTRTAFINGASMAAALGEPTIFSLQPIEIEIGGATIFTFPVRRLVRLQGGQAAPATDETWPSDDPITGGSIMQLVLSIVQSNDADAVSDALVAAGYRVTRMSTAGGFLRRGNATLLIGVEKQEVDNVLKVIQGACQRRDEPSPLTAGMPMYNATVFVLDASSFQHL